MNKNWRFYKLTNLTGFALLRKDVPMGCKNAVLHKHLLKNHTVNCLTFEENTSQPQRDTLFIFRAPAFHLHRNQRLEEETSKIFNIFMSRMDGLSSSQFQVVHMNKVLFVEDLLLLNILLYHIDIVRGNFVGELALRSAQKHESTVRLLRYNKPICYVNNRKAVFQSFQSPNCDTFSEKHKKTFNLERNFTTCSEQVKNVYRRTYIKPKNLCLTSCTLLELNTLMS